MNALTVQNPHHKCDWETRMTTESLTVIIINYIIYIVCVTTYIPVLPVPRVHKRSVKIKKKQFCGFNHK